MTTFLIIFSVTYASCGALAYGFTLGFFCRKYPSLPDLYDGHVKLAWLMALSGPLGLIVSGIDQGFSYGLLYRNPFKGV